MLRLIGCVTEQHDDWLVGVAVLVCLLACVTAMNLTARAFTAGGRARAAWIAGASAAFGGGVWDTHFIAMLAFRPGLPFGFAVPLTAVSLVLPVFGAALAISVQAYGTPIVGPVWTPIDRRDLSRRVLDTLDQAGLAPERLELEITEGVLMDDTDRAVAILRDLKARGVRIALDDFGTGFSSLSYLRRFRFDTLKIDTSFVAAIGEDAEADAIIRAVIALGHSLNLDVIAEGVETPAQLAHLLAEEAMRA